MTDVHDAEERQVADRAAARPSLRTLQEHRQALIAERLALGPAWTDLDLVFPSRSGTAAEPRKVLREFHAW
jgi:hypothetical protein